MLQFIYHTLRAMYIPDYDFRRARKAAPEKKKLDFTFTVSDKNVDDLVVLPHIRSN